MLQLLSDVLHLPNCAASSNWNANYHATTSYWNTFNYSKLRPKMYHHIQVFGLLIQSNNLCIYYSGEWYDNYSYLLAMVQLNFNSSLMCTIFTFFSLNFPFIYKLFICHFTSSQNDIPMHENNTRKFSKCEFYHKINVNKSLKTLLDTNLA